MRADIYWWPVSLRYEWWSQIIRLRFGNYISWNYAKFTMLTDQFREDMLEAAELYCMGGEL